MSNQLIKKDPSEGYKYIYPKTFIDAIKDKESGKSLIDILSSFNMYFLSYNGSRELTRLQVPLSLRKTGLWITYVLYDKTVVTEWYAGEAIDDNSWKNLSNWRVGTNMLVGDISISSDGYWVVNGVITTTKAQGEQGITPMLRVRNNHLQVSYTKGSSWIDVLEFTNSLHIKGYVATVGALPSSAVQGDIYGVGPTYDPSDTGQTNPIYQLYVKDSTGWVNNGKFTSIAAGVVQTTGTSTTEVMSQDAVSKKFAQVETNLNYSISKKIDKIVGKNLLNPNDPEIILGKFLQGGSISNDELYSISGYIDVTGISNITINFSLLGAYIVFYDEYKNYISSFASGKTFSVPSTAKYVRVSGPSLNQSIWQVESGINSTLFEEYTEYKPIRDLSNSVHNKVEKVIGKNLFDKNSDGVKIGYYLYAEGSLFLNADYIVSDYIEVEPNKTYVHSNLSLGGAYCCIYDADLVIISSFNSVNITTPSNARYIRLSVFNQLVDIAQFELGSVATEFSPYTELGFMEKVLEQVPTRDVECILPSKMYFIKGKQSCIYHENVLLKNLNDPTTLFFNKGINYNRQTTFNFAASSTNQTLSSQIIRSFKKGQLKSITYDVIDPTVNNGKVVNALHIGDSFTDIGSWVKETKNLLNSQGVTYNLLGTCGNSTFRAEGLSGGTLANTFLNSSLGVGRMVEVTGMVTLPSTTYPGQTYKDANGRDWTIRSGKIDTSGNGRIVVTKANANESDFINFPTSGVLTKTSNGEGDSIINYSNPTFCYYNPFINPSTGLIDIANYITTWGFENPDIVLLQFTWNDLGIWEFDYTINNLVSQFKSAADHIHSAYPNAKIILSIEPFGSINGNLDWNGKKYTVLRLTELLLIQFEDDLNYNSWVKIAPSYAFVDLVNGYGGGASVVPCERYPSITEVSGGDGVHPNTGMLQIADCVSQIVSAII